MWGRLDSTVPTFQFSAPRRLGITNSVVLTPANSVLASVQKHSNFQKPLLGSKLPLQLKKKIEKGKD
jgi:hypothetical protein